MGAEYDHAIDMWSLGCILYEMAIGSPIFPARDENELMEYFFVSIGPMPSYLIDCGKKKNQFFVDTSGGYALKRSKLSSFKQEQIVPQSQPVEALMKGYADPYLIDFICKCLVYEPEDRLTPQAALHHAWLLDFS